MADGTVIYLSFVEAIRTLPKKYQFDALEAVVVYGATGEEPDLGRFPPAMSAIWTLIKPQVDANNRRRQNGANGGRPKKDDGEKLKKPMVTDAETTVKPKRKSKSKNLLFLSEKVNGDGDRPDVEAGPPSHDEPPTADEIQETMKRLRQKGARG